MANWVGFSDEELRRLKQDVDPDSRGGRPQTGTRPARGRPARGRASPRDRASPSQRSQPASHTKPSPSLPPEARLSQPPDEERPRKPAPAKPVAARQMAPQAQAEISKPETREELQTTRECNGNESKSSKPEDDEDLGMILDDKDIIIQELQNVEKFQFQQKRIEEQNKKKRELLTSAIIERQKAAKQEATRLTKIQKDLAQLDQLLAIDVSIIRNKIEEASREYLEAQRRYERAEKEFIESKMDLHTKVNFKDSLTEHLHMVIHQNEVRKARKLTELMEKLSMEDGTDTESLSEELSVSAPSAFILGSLQSTQEQRAMMQRKRGGSESSEKSPTAEVTPGRIKKTGSEAGSPEPVASGRGSGVTGWISSWILGGGGTTAESTSKDGEDSAFTAGSQAASSGGGGPSAEVVTQAPGAKLKSGEVSSATVPTLTPASEATPTTPTGTSVSPSITTPIPMTTPTTSISTIAPPTIATSTNATPTNATPTSATPTIATPTSVTPTSATPPITTPTSATPPSATPPSATISTPIATPTSATPPSATPTSEHTGSAPGTVLGTNDSKPSVVSADNVSVGEGASTGNKALVADNSPDTEQEATSQSRHPSPKDLNDNKLKVAASSDRTDPQS